MREIRVCLHWPLEIEGCPIGLKVLPVQDLKENLLSNPGNTQTNEKK